MSRSSPSQEEMCIVQSRGRRDGERDEQERTNPNLHSISHSQSQSQQNNKQHNADAPSNEYVLNVAFISFLVFIMTQGAFAVVANSQAMMADSRAMSVDAFTYLFNLLAERLKHRSNKHASNNNNTITEEVKRQKRLYRLYLEFLPPLLSVVALVAVSVSALKEAVETIVLELQETPILRHPTPNPTVNGVGGAPIVLDNEEEPNAHLMFIFSLANLILDILNVTCFARTIGGPTIGVGYAHGHDNQQQHEYQTPGDAIMMIERNIEEGTYKCPEQQTLLSKTTSASSGSISNLNCGSHSPSASSSVAIPSTCDDNNKSNDHDYQQQHDDNDDEEDQSYDNTQDHHHESNSLLSCSSHSTATEDLHTKPPSSSSLQSLQQQQEIFNVNIDTTSHHSSSSSLGQTHSNYGSHGSTSTTTSLDRCSQDNMNRTMNEGEGEEAEDDDNELNLNMCSAYTHVMADTFRSISVLIAASIACSFDDVSPEMADATAAVVVSGIIAMSLGPLIMGLIQTWNEIQDVRAEAFMDVEMAGGGGNSNDTDDDDCVCCRQQHQQQYQQGVAVSGLSLLTQ